MMYTVRQLPSPNPSHFLMNRCPLVQFTFPLISGKPYGEVLRNSESESVGMSSEPLFQTSSNN